MTTTNRASQDGRSRKAQRLISSRFLTGELLVHPVVQAGQRGLDHRVDVLEVVVVP